MQAYLEERDNRAAAERHKDNRDDAELAWFNGKEDPAARLLAFDSWARRQLATRLDWTWAGTAKDKRVEQCRLQLNGVVRHLFKRGWLLDGKRLAARITDLINAVAAQQEKGVIRDFWPYFKASVDRYVGLNAEELRQEAMEAGVHAGQMFAQMTKGLPAGPSVPELEAQRTEETLRAKLAGKRRQNARKQANAGQLPLL
ncbi:MAG: hypothetical protein Q8J78_13930 [Moraxellaceae bacterium]|nr:hypothetical protein [Moraxellaceae bacterium]